MLIMRLDVLNSVSINQFISLIVCIIQIVDKEY